MKRIVLHYQQITDSNSGVVGSTPGGDVYGWVILEHTSSNLDWLAKDMANKIEGDVTFTLKDEGVITSEFKVSQIVYHLDNDNGTFTVIRAVVEELAENCDGLSIKTKQLYKQANYRPRTYRPSEVYPSFKAAQLAGIKFYSSLLLALARQTEEATCS